MHLTEAGFWNHFHLRIELTPSSLRVVRKERFVSDSNITIGNTDMTFSQHIWKVVIPDPFRKIGCSGQNRSYGGCGTFLSFLMRVNVRENVLVSL